MTKVNSPDGKRTATITFPSYISSAIYSRAPTVFRKLDKLDVRLGDVLSDKSRVIFSRNMEDIAGVGFLDVNIKWLSNKDFIVTYTTKEIDIVSERETEISCHVGRGCDS